MADTGTFPEIPLFDLRLEDEDIEAVLDTLRSGWLTMGPRTAAFEAAFAEHLGVRHAVAVSSCTAALHLAYLAAGIGPGDEVIVPAMTFAATAAAVVYCGGTPVFADVAGPHDLALDPDDVERRIGPRTKAVARGALRRLPGARRAPARAVRRPRARADRGRRARPVGRVAGRKLGAWGLAGAFSFFSNKILSCGEGGLLATDDDEVAALARSLRSPGHDLGHVEPAHGRDRRLRRRRPRLQLPARRAARRAAALAAGAHGGRHRPPPGADPRLPRPPRRARRPARAVRRRGRRALLVLRDAGADRRSRAPRRRPPPPARAGRADVGLLSRDARVHRLPRPVRRERARAHGADRPLGDHDPAVSAPGPRTSRTASSTRSPRRSPHELGGPAHRRGHRRRRTSTPSRSACAPAG